MTVFFCYLVLCCVGKRSCDRLASIPVNSVKCLKRLIVSEWILNRKRPVLEFIQLKCFHTWKCERGLHISDTSLMQVMSRVAVKKGNKFETYIAVATRRLALNVPALRLLIFVLCSEGDCSNFVQHISLFCLTSLLYEKRGRMRAFTVDWLTNSWLRYR